MTNPIITSIVSGSMGAAILAFVQFLINFFVERADKKKDNRTQYERELEAKMDAQSEMLVGLGHNTILTEGAKYIKRGWVSSSEYDDLYTYLYRPYKALGGNGTAEKVMEEVRRLPGKEEKDETI